VYGQKREFKDVMFAMEVYRFAHEKQIDCLMTALDDYLTKTISATTVLEAYEFYTSIEHAAGQNTCKLVF
jgi:hypothetical protein